MTATATPRRLGNLMVERGYISFAQLEQALATQAATGKTKLLGEILIEQELCTEEQVLEGIAEEFQIPFARLDQRLADPKIVEVLPREFIEKNLIFPLFCVRDVLTVATAEPANLFLIDEVRHLSRKEVQIVAASSKDIRRLFTSLPDSKTFVIDDIIEDNDQTNVTLLETASDDLGDLEDFSGQSPVIRLVNYLIYHAVKQGASDIHIEPADRCLWVRYRIDGRLHKSLEVPSALLGAVTSRIKIMASLDIAERRLPQDGCIHVSLDGRKIDLRVSTFPGSRGEKTAIRVLDTRNISLNLRDLGFAEDVLTTFQENIHVPNGMILVTGPTGSGKTTTLYAALSEVSSMENNVCTVEDPIEYRLPLINQFQVHEKAGLTFSSALRTLLRQDPDVIMVGEVRDEETARTAIQAALTGHLVLSTLHTNDSVSAITRLLNMGVESYLISASLNMVLAQRLVRRICGKCRQVYEPNRHVRKTLERIGCSVDRFFKGVGCRKCHNTGYSGRAGVHELLVADEWLRDAIAKNSNAIDLRRHAEQSGMITLKYDGFRKVREGITTLEEVLLVAGETQSLQERKSVKPASDDGNLSPSIADAMVNSAASLA